MSTGRNPAPWQALLTLAGAASREDLSGVAPIPAALWPDVLDECNTHWLTPLVYRALAADHDRLGVPPEIWRRFRKIGRLSRLRSRRTLDTAEPVLAALEGAGIPSIVLKGMHLATQVYAAPALRPMVDIDLLLHRRDLAAAAAIVTAQGFRQTEEGSWLARWQRRRVGRRAHHLGAFLHPDKPAIELHYTIEAPRLLPDIDVEALWRRAARVRIGAAGAAVLSPEDTLVHLCTHAAIHHGFGLRLGALCDIAVVLHRWRGGLDWSAVWDRGEAWGAKRSLVLGLAFCRDRLGSALPDAGSAPLEAYGGEIAGLLDIAADRMRSKAEALARRRPMPRLTAFIEGPSPAPPEADPGRARAAKPGGPLAFMWPGGGAERARRRAQRQSRRQLAAWLRVRRTG